MSAIDDLDSLGIDRATTRWRAARAYMQGVRREIGMQIDRAVIGVVVAAKAEQNAERDGRQGWPTPSDYGDAVEWMGDRLAR